ncbi:MAG: tetratricopeptide repeat protein [Hyphomicrobiaceae bacterium]
MSLGLVVLIAGVIFALVVAALPLWDIRHQLWATWDWRDWTRVALATLALLLPVAVFMIALPYVPWLEAIIPKSLVPAEWGGLRSQRHHMEALSKHGLAAVEPASGVDHSDVSIPLSNLAELYCEQGRYLEAEALYERVLAIREGVLGPYHPSLSVVLTRIADLYRAQGRYTEAEPLYRRALTIYQTAFGPDHPSSATTLSNLALLLFAQGRLEEAEPLLKRSFASRGSPGVAYPEVGVGLSHLADLYRAQGRYVEAEPLYKRSLTMFEDALDRLSSTQDGSGQIFQTAQRALAAESGASLAETALLRLKGDLQFGTADKSDIPQFSPISHSEPLSVGQVQANLRSDEALILYLTMPERSALLVFVVTKTDVRWQRSDLAAEALNESTAALFCGLERMLWNTQSAHKCRELLQLPAQLDGQAPEILPFHLARAHDLYMALLAPFRDIVRNKSLLIVASRSLSNLPFNVLVTEPPKTAILSKLDQYRDVPWLGTQYPITLLPSVSALRVLRQRAETSHAQKMYLGMGNPLLDGQQDHLEWGGYYKKQAQASWDKQQCSELPVADRTVVGIRPVISPREGHSNVDKIRRWAPLPETADELCEVGRRLGASKSDILLGSQATESLLKDLSKTGRLAQYRILYFATHCALTVSEPGLILTPQHEAATDATGKLDRDDGLLTADEIKALKLDADWVALSPCSTADGSRENADILSVLAGSFFHAGARALLIPYWQVGLGATVKLTTGAFAELNANPTIGQAKAMRNSMRNLMMHGSLLEAHPSQWAPFVVVGKG